MYHLAGKDGLRNSESADPGGSLQPWSGSSNTKTVLDCDFLPLSGVFSMPGTIPGGRHRFVLTLNNDLRKRCIVMDSARAALTSSQQNYVYCQIEEVRFHMCHLVPDAPVPVPRNVVLSSHPLSVVKSPLSSAGDSSAHTLSVPPSTDRLFVGVNLTTAGSTHGVHKTATTSSSRRCLFFKSSMPGRRCLIRRTNRTTRVRLTGMLSSRTPISLPRAGSFTLSSRHTTTWRSGPTAKPIRSPPF